MKAYDLQAVLATLGAGAGTFLIAMVYFFWTFAPHIPDWWSAL